MAELTISVENETYILVPADLEQSVEQLKRVIEFEISVKINQQVLTYDGKVLDNAKKLSEYSIKNGDMILLTKNIFTQPQQQQQQHQQQQQQQQQQPQQHGGFAQPPNEIFASADSMIDYFTKNPEGLGQIIETNPQLAEAILSKDKKALTNVCEQFKSQRRMQELAIKDPFGEEYQKLLYEQIQKQNIEENMAHAMEHTPEVFASVYMLYIKCSINNFPIKAFVDTGAQQSIMSEKVCIDKRKIIVNISLILILVFNFFYSKGTFQIGEEKLEYLHEKDLKDILGSEGQEEEDLKKVTQESLKTTSPTPSSTTTTSTVSPTTSATSTASISSPSVTSPTNTTPTSTRPVTNTFSAMPEESINVLMSLGCSRERAIRLLTQTRGNVDAAASLFFG
ncbi:hypothetical protein DICPUDRAFT_76108 [Dictyostelium purpureum]|uniref:UV excision repair protein RAD23 n=1 Tax=Dictyostelium purpureum TaxID=5786 RepID=F0ZCM1_DICPU|nr:uncharacterized protein DICPUDRAFT_76108 [Dictyostelium purpureum]EGC38294.1 hypothetical protein DICPUDRAFT_76108 [Dictyostelium purpureum]|eukprot:XP_003285155.1 hypothetical protein DICPUDRAFT_76108 [Dictyostelium purpureum]